MDCYPHRRGHRPPVRGMRPASNAGPRRVRAPHAQSTPRAGSCGDGVLLGRSSVMDRLALFALALYVLSVGFVWQNRSAASALAQDPPPQIEQPAPPKLLSRPVKVSFDVEKIDKEPASVYKTCGI